jgi:hypothetical protein
MRIRSAEQLGPRERVEVIEGHVTGLEKPEEHWVETAAFIKQYQYEPNAKDIIYEPVDGVMMPGASPASFYQLVTTMASLCVVLVNDAYEDCNEACIVPEIHSVLLMIPTAVQNHQLMA